MVCFCDIPLSQISEHTDYYGYYVMAMSKEWARDRGVSPVIYYSGKESLSLRLFKRNEKLISPKDKVLWLSMQKKYRGKTWSWKEMKYKTKVLYNEREWRYIPQNIPFEEMYKEVEYDGFRGSSISNNTRQYGLSFSYKDSRYIIIKEEKERAEFLEKMKSVFLDDSIEKIVSSKIPTFEQIKEDF